MRMLHFCGHLVAALCLAVLRSAAFAVDRGFDGLPRGLAPVLAIAFPLRDARVELLRAQAAQGVASDVAGGLVQARAFVARRLARWRSRPRSVMALDLEGASLAYG